MPHDMIDEYFKIYNNSIDEYGERTCVFYACGSFYEVYRVENEKEVIGNANVIAEIIRCDFSNKNRSKRLIHGSTREFPDFCGFGIAYLSKYLPPLLENNYTVVIVDQLESSSDRRGKLVKRGVVAVHSPSLKSCDLETYLDTESNLINLFLQITPKYANLDSTLIYSTVCVNNTTNKIEITESSCNFKLKEFHLLLEDITKIISRYYCREIQIYIVKSYYNTNHIIRKFFNEYTNDYTNISLKFYDIDTQDTRYLEYNKRQIQNQYFKSVYKHINFGLIEPLEYFNLSDKELSVVNFMYTLDFMAKHDSKYITNLTIPEIINQYSHLVLELNTSSQLNILPNHNITHKLSSVFDVVNHTTTSIGRRHLKSLLAKPFRDRTTIQHRYDLTEELQKYTDLANDLQSELSKIIDFERLHRKMGLGSLHPYEFEKLHNTYRTILDMFTIISKDKHVDLLFKGEIPDERILQDFTEYISDYTTTFNLNTMRSINLNTNKDEIVNFFNRGIVEDLDKIQRDICTIENTIEELRKSYDQYINDNPKTPMIRLGFTDNDGYFFTCTKIRYQRLIKEYQNKKEEGKNEVDFTMRATSNTCKFSSDDLVKLSNRLINTRELLVKRVKSHYLLKLQEYSNKYNKIFKSLLQFIEIVDISNSNLKCFTKYKYCKPQITDSEDSFVIAKSIRHPIIELINTDTEYIPNDISLTRDSSGMLLYGLNSSGKSSLLRSLGISIVLAQSGLYVPCKSFNFAPFYTMISQVDLTDNLFANKSSFTSEMCGLKKILQCKSSNTLVLSDELCRGTEVNSSSAIVASTLLELVKSNTKFFFTTHLHDLQRIEEIRDEPKINTCHLSVDTTDDVIVFQRRLKPGSGSDLYGLEVCKSIISDTAFIDRSFQIRNRLISGRENNTVLSQKRSNYNKRKILNHCEVCGYKPKVGNVPLDTHHINEQKNCDLSGFVNEKHFHKNELYNLVSLCKPCHLKIDTGELVIRGYKMSTRGVLLDYTLL
jgi:DNA mismatch repair protein MutS